MNIKRFDESCMEGGGVAQHANGEYVKYADHISSHAYDEAKEREMARFYYDADISKTSSWHDFLCGWMACAKSRARSSE